MKVWLLLLFAALSLQAASLPICSGSTITGCIYNRTGWPKAYGGPYDLYYQPVPTSLTQIDVKPSRLLGVCVANTTGSPITFTFQTLDTSPLAYTVNR